MYETGVFIAFCFWIYGTIMLIVNLNSQAARNLRKIGLRYRWNNLQPVQMQRGDYAGRPMWNFLKCLFWLLSGLILMALSWLAVAWSVFMIVYGLQKSAGKPTVIREFEWRIRNVNLSFDEIVEAMVQAGVMKGTAEEIKASIRSDIAAAIEM